MSLRITDHFGYIKHCNRAWRSALWTSLRSILGIDISHKRRFQFTHTEAHLSKIKTMQGEDELSSRGQIKLQSSIRPWRRKDLKDLKIKREQKRALMREALAQAEKLPLMAGYNTYNRAGKKISAAAMEELSESSESEKPPEPQFDKDPSGKKASGSKLKVRDGHTMFSLMQEYWNTWLAWANPKENRLQLSSSELGFQVMQAQNGWEADDAICALCALYQGFSPLFFQGYYFEKSENLIFMSLYQISLIASPENVQRTSSAPVPDRQFICLFVSSKDAWRTNSILGMNVEGLNREHMSVTSA